jgi:hypothetical protein
VSTLKRVANTPPPIQSIHYLKRSIDSLLGVGKKKTAYRGMRILLWLLHSVHELIPKRTVLPLVLLDGDAIPNVACIGPLCDFRRRQ